MHVQSWAHLRECWDGSQSPACMLTPSWPEDEPTGLSKSVALRRGSCRKSLTGLLVAAHEVGVGSWRHLDVQRAIKGELFLEGPHSHCRVAQVCRNCSGNCYVIDCTFFLFNKSDE